MTHSRGQTANRSDVTWLCPSFKYSLCELMWRGAVTAVSTRVLRGGSPTVFTSRDLFVFSRHKEAVGM